MYVREEHPYQGTASYFRNVQRQHQPWPALPAATTGEQAAAGEGGGGSEGWTLVEQTGAEASVSSGARTSALQSSTGAGVQAPGGGESEQDASCWVPVTCINLLHANPKKASELMLSSHFQDVSLLGVLTAVPGVERLPLDSAGCLAVGPCRALHAAFR